MLEAGEASAGVAAQIDQALLRLPKQLAVEPRESLLAHLALVALPDLVLGHRAELQGQQLARPLADAVGDVVACNYQVLADLVLAAQDDVAVGVVRVEVVDCHPVEARVEIPLHLGHQAADEWLEVVELGPVLRRDDEAELVAVALAAPLERLAVGLVAGRVVEPAGLTLAGHSVALDVSEMRLGRADALPLELDDARLDDDAPTAGDRRPPHRRARSPASAAPDPRTAEG